jgi:hypothetical protein
VLQGMIAYGMIADQLAPLLFVAATAMGYDAPA